MDEIDEMGPIDWLLVEFDGPFTGCLLYTSDAADDLVSV